MCLLRCSVRCNLIFCTSHLTYVEEYYSHGADDETFGVELTHLPSLQSITFDLTGSDLPWRILKRCLQLTSATSISLIQRLCRARTDPYPEDEIAIIQSRLKHFSYARNMWRMITNDPRSSFNMALDVIISYLEEIPFDTRCFSPLIFTSSRTLESLDFPFESAPLQQMAHISWPNLRRLTLRGTVHDERQVQYLREFLTGTLLLTELALEIAPVVGASRVQILRPQTEDEISLQLKSLTIAYPDPHDLIFSAVGKRLQHLSLTDYPPLYYFRAATVLPGRWAAPVLSSSECLAILERMSLNRLTSLALVYVWDEAEDDLLRYITQGEALPQLSHLELHRYRQVPQEVVPCVRLFTFHRCLLST